MKYRLDQILPVENLCSLRKNDWISFSFQEIWANQDLPTFLLWIDLNILEVVLSKYTYKVTNKFKIKLLLRNHKDHQRNALNINYLILPLSSVNLNAVVQSFAIQIRISNIYWQEDFRIAQKYFQRRVYFLLESTWHLWLNLMINV